MADLSNFEQDHPVVLTVPGLDNSGPGHWQSIWERERPDCHRVDLGMWSAPRRNVWVTQLNTAITSTGRPVILVAHSLGCLAVAWWAALEGQSYAAPVAGALLVAPPEVDSVGPDTRLVGFGPAPKCILPFPSIVVASRNDPYIAIERAHSLSKFWGSAFVDAGEVGHINAGSDLGDWRAGQELLEILMNRPATAAPVAPARVPLGSMLPSAIDS